MGFSPVTIREALQEFRVLGIDTSPFIYFVERHPQYSPLVRSIIERAEAGETELVTSVLTLTEVLTLPLQQNADAIATSYRSILLNSPYIRVLTIDSEVAEEAARLRARYRLGTPDAIQLAVTLRAGCDAFLTNDKKLKRVQELPVLLLSELRKD
jgi:predicted nucleic acid-binding protein